MAVWTHSLARLIIAVLLIVAVPQGMARAQSILRDAEMEAFFREISDPVFEAAGLTPQSVQMYLIADNSLNAFVAGGQNVFIHSGLILQADNVDQLRGVIAHEACHIACAHSISRRDAYAKTAGINILSMVLGAIAIAAGAADAGLGLLLGGQTASQLQFFAHTRGEESEADIAAVRYLDTVGVTSRGLVEFFEKLRDQEVLALRRQDPYVRTHPLNRTRIQRLESVVSRSPYLNASAKADVEERFQRLKAKLYGYMQPTRGTLAIYPERDTSLRARYARVYAYHKDLRWDDALYEADQLIAAEPDNAYFHEIKGQILYENHRIAESVEAFERAVTLAPQQPLLMTAYGQALVSLETDESMRQAVPILKAAAYRDNRNTFAWFNLARAYSWLGDESMANLATAERFYAAGALPQAYGYARRAQGALKTGSPDWIRMQDILAASERAALQQQQGGRRRRR